MKKIPEILFQPALQKENLGLECLRLEELLSRFSTPVNHNPFQVHRLHFYALLLIEQGEVRHTVDFQEYSLSAGDCLLIASGQVHAFDQVRRYKGYLILFTNTFLYQYLAVQTVQQIQLLFGHFLQCTHLHAPVLNKALIQQFLNVPKELREEYRACLLGTELAKYLLLLKQDTIPNTNLSVSGKTHQLFHAFREMLTSHFAQSRNAAYYAEKLHVTYRQMNEACKMVTQKTAKQFIDHFLIMEAKRRLALSGMSVKEVSFEMGFEEPSNFIKYFKKHTQKTPSEFLN